MSHRPSPLPPAVARPGSAPPLSYPSSSPYGPLSSSAQFRTQRLDDSGSVLGEGALLEAMRPPRPVWRTGVPSSPAAHRRGAAARYATHAEYPRRRDRSFSAGKLTPWATLASLGDPCEAVFPSSVEGGGLKP